MKKLIPLTSLILLNCSQLFAQDAPKLKEVQATAMWAPSPVKVDGKVAEWNDSFQAYNKATKLYYTMANDDKNLYLAIKSTDATNNLKIVAGGITLAINTAGKKKEKEGYNITFPVIARPTRQPGQAGGGRPGGDAVRMGGFGGFGGGAADSATMAAMHARVIASSKEIKVSGFKDIPDSLISIYNSDGIKAAIGYDAKGNFIYELAVSLKNLSLDAGNPKEFAYNVKVNGLQITMRPMEDGDGVRGGGRGGFGGGGGGFGGPPGGGSFGGPPGGQSGRGGFNFQEMISASDFWGKYTLAKKQ